jgi:hypothetical protein
MIYTVIIVAIDPTIPTTVPLISPAERPEEEDDGDDGDDDGDEEDDKVVVKLVFMVVCVFVVVCVLVVVFVKSVDKIIVEVVGVGCACGSDGRGMDDVGIGDRYGVEKDEVVIRITGEEVEGEPKIESKWIISRR